MSLWSYSNLHTDEGRRRGKGFGNELCDLLVVFGNDVIIFSDKYIKFNQTIDTIIAWKRWYKKAVRKSANQLFGAENWLRNYKERIYVDPQCTTRLPICIPDRDKIRVFRIAVALGVYEACKNFFGGNSLGSLMVNSAIAGEEHYDHPFHIGHVNPSKGFVHVFDDFTLNAVLRELDTVSDFISYLVKREIFLSKNKPMIVAAGEEQLLSIYLTKLNQDGEHDFVLPGKSNADFISFDESFWESMVHNPQYIRKKEADRISYVWDSLIERFAKYGGIYDESGSRYQDISMLEQGLRIMASEPRIRRRQLADALGNLLENTPEGKGATRVVYSNDFPANAYVFLILE